jgi:4-diphosphocytidyl-2-C-methyl-D-erythritol kinase
MTAANLRVRIRVPAKLNLFLGVRGRRDDGYHDLVSVMQSVGIHDRLTASMSEVGGLHPTVRSRMSISLTHGAASDLPCDDGNLAVRAAHVLLASLGGRPMEPNGDGPVTRLHLRKRIPIAGGMAGGSADAAAALVALNELWDCGLDTDELRELAAQLGADVPFCVQGGTALATGTGTQTAQVLCRGRAFWVVGINDEPLATSEVYAAWDEHCAPSETEPDAVLTALGTGDLEALGAALHNDLEAAAFVLRPKLEKQRDRLLAEGAMGAIVSGSGPTVLGLATDQVSAQRLAARVEEDFDRMSVAVAPAGGPEVLSDVG